MPGGEPQADGLPAVLDTTEMRWFAAGPVADDVMAWFAGAGSDGFDESRCDVYLLGTGPDVGVKRRDGRLLERKVRTARHPARSLPAGPTGPIEDWRKHSPADDVAGADDRARWLAIDKVVHRRRFTSTGLEIASPSGPPVPGGCDVEVTEVGFGATTAWSLAFAAAGPRHARESAIRAAWARLLGDAAAPPPAIEALRWSGGYPAWLADRRPAPTATRASLVG